MTLEQLNKNYIYKSDQNQFGRVEHWQVMKPNEKGQFVGDCEDYCLTLKKLIPQFKGWDFYYCTLDGIGHCVLMKNNSIIDCNCQAIMLIDKYKEAYNVSNLKKIGLFTVFSKFVFGKLFSLFAIIK